MIGDRKTTFIIMSVSVSAAVLFRRPHYEGIDNKKSREWFVG